MALKKCVLFAFFLFLSCVYSTQGKPCDFSKACTCTYSIADGSLDSVNCALQDQSFPTFLDPGEGKRYETEKLIVTGNVNKIPARHFLAFESINRLTLIQTTPNTKQEWDSNAFNGTKIYGFDIRKLSSLFPTPAALRQLTTLQLLSISEDTTSSKLTDDDLKNFRGLELLSIYDTVLTSIDPNAFASVQNLKQLTLNKTSLTAVPSAALTLSTKLESLRLENNAITVIPNNAFEKLTQLNELFLDDNPISKIEDGAFSPLISLKSLSLRNSKLTYVDLSMTARLPRLQQVYLNNATELKNVSASASQMPNTMQGKIHLETSGLETIDSRIDDLLENNPRLTISIAQTVHLQCKDIDWMAKRVSCTRQLDIILTKCADGEWLDYYLSKAVKDPCHKAISSTTTTTSTSTSTSTTTTSTPTTKRSSTATSSTATARATTTSRPTSIPSSAPSTPKSASIRVTGKMTMALLAAVLLIASELF